MGIRLEKKSWVHDVQGTENPMIGSASRSCVLSQDLGVIVSLSQRSKKDLEVCTGRRKTRKERNGAVAGSG